jgi:hypothetical protein
MPVERRSDEGGLVHKSTSLVAFVENQFRRNNDSSVSESAFDS